MKQEETALHTIEFSKDLSQWFLFKGKLLFSPAVTVSVGQIKSTEQFMCLGFNVLSCGYLQKSTDMFTMQRL